MRSQLKAGRFPALALAAMIALIQTPIGQLLRVDARAAAPNAETARVSADAVRAPAGQPANVPAPQPASAPARVVSIAPDDTRLSDKLRQQTQEKYAKMDRIKAVPSISGAHAGDPVDQNQPAITELVSSGRLKISPETLDAYAYVQPYKEPNDYAHRNYCGPGAATVLISHFDGDYPKNVDIDRLGEQMNMDPDGGVWVRDIVKPVNDQVNRVAGQELNWYQYGQATTKDEFRWMLNMDIGKNGVPLITSLMTAGLPGWGETDVGHIVAVYGYHRDANGTEWVTYADTATPASGYDGGTFHTVTLDTFWQAVSQNSAQVW